MKKKIFIIPGLVVAGLAALVIMTLRDAGEFTEITPHFSHTCKTVRGVPGAEDIAIDASTGIAFISSQDRRAYVKEGKMLQGAIYSYTLEGEPRLKNLTAGLKIKFHPHGISFFHAPDGRRLLFVINHVQPGHRVEIFEYEKNTLVHRETVSDPLMVSPNDIAAVGPKSFFFTNDHGSGSAFAARMEDFLRLSRSNIVYYDGKVARVVAGDIAYANGIWATADGKLLYATATTGKKFYIFGRGPNGALRLIQALDMWSGGDNIDVDSSGTIRVTGHLKLLSFLRHAADETNKAPSHILELRRDPEGGYYFRETDLDDGELMSAVSVAAGYRDRLLIGSVFGSFFADCKAR